MKMNTSRVYLGKAKGTETSYLTLKLNEFSIRKDRLKRIKADKPILCSKKIRLIGEINTFISPLTGQDGARRIAPFLSLIDEIKGEVRA